MTELEENDEVICCDLFGACYWIKKKAILNGKQTAKQAALPRLYNVDSTV